MKKFIIVSLIISAALWGCSTDESVQNDQASLGNAAHQNAKKIISQLSLDEKLAQLQTGSIYIISSASDEQGNINVDTLKKYYPYGIGIMNLNWAGAPQEKYCRQVNSLKAYNKTLKHPIPMIFVGEGLHGLMSQGCTVFPQAIALGCSFDTTLTDKVYRVTAAEAKARGINLLFSPILDLARDPRFGRIEEMYSEDPYLCGKLGKTAVIAFQDRKEDGSLSMASTLKHYMGHGQVEGGRNVASYPGNYNDLLNNHLTPFRMCVEAGTECIMPAYNDVCDVPVTVNKYLLNDILRKELNFKGLIISDQNAIDVVCTVNSMVATLQEAAEKSIKAGIDVDVIGAQGTFQLLKKSVEEKKLKESDIDKALERLLVTKYKLGLFEKDNDVDIAYMNKITNCAQHKAIARECAQKTCVLLENNGILPLDSLKYKKIAVIGPNATELPYGGYDVEPKTPGITILDGFKEFMNGKGEILYAEGCRYATTQGAFWGNDNQKKEDPKVNQQLIAQAVATAQKSELVILCVGENESFAREAWAETHRGDRDNLEFLEPQIELIEKIRANGKPVVILVTGGRPFNVKPAADNSDALVECFYIGQEGGHAITDLLFGKCNFEGRLSVSMPHSVGSLPCFYNMKPNRFRSYIYEEKHCLYPFGYGLSYSKFEISQPECDKETYSKKDVVKITVTVKNISTREGSETVQLYIKDDISECVRPIKELRGFSKVYLKGGETKEVCFNITKDDLMYYNSDLKRIFEEGTFTVMAGNSSENFKSCKFEMK